MYPDKIIAHKPVLTNVNLMQLGIFKLSEV
jgi:hypothetical protein